MRYTPKGNKEHVSVSCICLIFSAFILLTFSPLTDTSSFIRNLFRMSGYTLLVATTLIVARYLTFTYTYILDDFEFIIVKSSINKKQTVCRLYFSDIVEICEAKNNTKTKPATRHNYCASLMPDKAYLLFYRFDDNEGVITFEPDFCFLKELEKRIKNDIILD